MGSLLMTTNQLEDIGQFLCTAVLRASEVAPSGLSDYSVEVVPAENGGNARVELVLDVAVEDIDEIMGNLLRSYELTCDTEDGNWEAEIRIAYPIL